MKKFFYFITILLISVHTMSCGQKKWDFSDADEIQEVGSKDVPIVELKPINISFPEANFTDPDSIYKQGKYSYTIKNRLIQLVNAVPEGDTIYCSFYLMNDEDVINSFLSAGRRGAKVNILIDSSRTSESIMQNIVAYQKFKKSPYVTYSAVRNSLMVSTTEQGINHNKFLAFSGIETINGRKENVIFQTSNNMTSSQMTLFQDNVILQSEGLYQSYRAYWKQMLKYAKGDMNKYTYSEYKNVSEGLEGYYFPKIKNNVYFGPDPIIEILDRITDPSTAKVKILMYSWSAARITIVDKLIELREKGASIDVIVSSDQTVSNIVTGLTTLSAKGGFVRYFKEQGTVKKGVHSKYLLIEGSFDGKNQSIVFTGSENYTNGALKQNLETLLGIYNSPVYADYASNFQKIKSL